MKQHTITLQGISLAYLEQNPQAKQTIFFMHGNSGSSGYWAKQFNDPAFSTYRLIAIDFPGHGKSASLENIADYNCIFFGRLMVEFMQTLNCDSRVILVGYSLGSNVAAEMLASAIRPSGIVFVGASVLGAGIPATSMLYGMGASNILFLDQCEAGVVDQFFNTLSSSREENDMLTIRADYYAVAKNFRSQFFQNSIGGKMSDEILLLNKLNVPLLVVFGNEEKIVNKDYLDNSGLSLWNETIYKIHGAGHSASFDNPILFNQLLDQYVKDIFK